ncbi:MAG: hypothetical protein PVG61_06190 [Dehalococcoidia bacterium]|jgi:hypothetical protein
MKAINKMALYISLITALPLISISCNIINGDIASPAPEEDNDLLPLMLHAVPATGTTALMYNDMRYLSESRGLEAPSQNASIEDKIEWWSSFQSDLLYGYPFPYDDAFWGFNAADISGILTYWGEGRVTILCGNLDTVTFRMKMLSYGYEESSYLGRPVLSGTPEPSGDMSFEVLPRAYGIINGVRIGSEPVNFILMSGSGNDPDQSIQNIKKSIAAYHQKTSLAGISNPLTRLAASVGEVGAAYITTDTSLTSILENASVEQAERMKAAIGPGYLPPYQGLAMTYRWEDGRIIYDFILAYETHTDAEAGVPVLRERLSQGHSYMFHDAPLSGVWTIRDVSSSDSLLKAKVLLLDTAPRYDSFFVVMVYAVDYWFLYPGQ